MADFKILMTAHGRGEVFMDGQKIMGVVAVEFRARTDSMNEVILTLHADTVELEGPAEMRDSDG